MPLSHELQLLAMRMMAAPWEEIILMREALDELAVERGIVSGLISASKATQAREAELREFLVAGARHRVDQRTDDAPDAVLGLLRVFLVEGVLAGNSDPVRRNAWQKLVGLTAAYR